jgi:hypothetical protein
MKELKKKNIYIYIYIYIYTHTLKIELCVNSLVCFEWLKKLNEGCEATLFSASLSSVLNLFN